MALFVLQLIEIMFNIIQQRYGELTLPLFRITLVLGDNSLSMARLSQLAFLGVVVEGPDAFFIGVVSGAAAGLAV